MMDTLPLYLTLKRIALYYTIIIVYVVVSLYTFFLEKNNRFYAYSTLSKCLLRIDEQTYYGLYDAQKKRSEVTLSNIEHSVLNILLNKHIICNSIDDQINLCQSIILHKRNIETFRHITIAPTMDCCFSCYYCFEKNKQKTYLSNEIINRIIQFIVSQKNLESLHITWFGGEPLMAIRQIKEFYTNFRPLFNGIYSSDIITTGYHINEEIINILTDIEISEVQITLDGLPQTHNNIKRIQNCKNVFNKITSNIDKLVTKAPQIKVSIRINLTKENSNEYVELYSFLSKRYKGKLVSISPGYVLNKGKVHRCDLFNNNDSARFSLALWKDEKIVTPWLLNHGGTECAISNKNSIVIDPEGYLYKCWEKIGQPQYRYGILNNDGGIDIISQMVLNNALYSNDPLKDLKCKECSYLPICFGGCPMQRIESNANTLFDNNLCSSYKGFLENWLSAYLDAIYHR